MKVDEGRESLLDALGGSCCTVCCGWVKNDFLSTGWLVVSASVYHLSVMIKDSKV